MNLAYLKKFYIDEVASVAIVCGTIIVIFGVGLGGAMVGSEYESSCVAKKGEEPTCTTRYVYKGLGGLDIPLPSLSVIASAVGMGFGIYAGLKNGKIPDAVKDVFNDSNNNEPPNISGGNL